MKDETIKYIWKIILICVGLICITLVGLSINPHIIRLEANEEFKEALQGIQIEQTTIYSDEVFIDQEYNNSIYIYEDYLAKPINKIKK